VRAVAGAGGGVRVLVAEDNFYTRLGTVAFLRGQPGIHVVGEAANGVRALELFAQLRPDVTIVDLRMPGMGGVELTTRLRQRAPDARILVLTHYEGDEDIFQALKAGAAGYLTKEAPGEDLIAAIRAVHAGSGFLPPEIAERLQSRSGLPQLTQREREVLAEIAEGASNREAASTLGISERTAGLYVSSILCKLGASSRTEAVSIATRRGLLPGRTP
jgi:two-component system NarL family response regulator